MITSISSSIAQAVQSALRDSQFSNGPILFIVSSGCDIPPDFELQSNSISPYLKDLIRGRYSFDCHTKSGQSQVVNSVKTKALLFAFRKRMIPLKHLDVFLCPGQEAFEIRKYFEGKSQELLVGGEEVESSSDTARSLILIATRSRSKTLFPQTVLNHFSGQCSNLNWSKVADYEIPAGGWIIEGRFGQK